MLKLIRKCLSCQKDFKSKSIYIRICGRCKDDIRGKTYQVPGTFLNTIYGRQPGPKEE